ncbi:MAG: YbaB/EbfC family nucleoid-associated protein, partial [Patescibacteria group bacterium]
MFNKLKAIKDVRSQAKQIEKALEGITSTGSSKGLTITINGKQEVIDVHVADTFDVKNIANAI